MCLSVRTTPSAAQNDYVVQNNMYLLWNARAGEMESDKIIGYVSTPSFISLTDAAGREQNVPVQSQRVSLSLSH